MTNWTIDQIRNQFLVISQPRAGTQMLERSLSAHPDVVMRTWSTSQDNPGSILDLYDFRPMDEQERQRPFRGTITHSWGEVFTKDQFGMALDQYWGMVGRFFPRVVILTRRNQLRRFLSYKVAETLNQWGVYEAPVSHPGLEFDFDEFLAFLHDTMVYRQSVARVFPNAFRVEYEDLVCDPSKYQELLGWLGIPYSNMNVTSHTYRQEYRQAWEVMSNWNPELETAFGHYGMTSWLYELP